MAWALPTFLTMFAELTDSSAVLALSAHELALPCGARSLHHSTSLTNVVTVGFSVAQNGTHLQNTSCVRAARLTLRRH